MAIENKPLISQVTPLRAREGKGQFLSEQPSLLTPISASLPSVSFSKHSFHPDYYLGGGKPFLTASPTLSAHPSSFLFLFF